MCLVRGYDNDDGADVFQGGNESVVGGDWGVHEKATGSKSNDRHPRFEVAYEQLQRLFSDPKIIVDVTQHRGRDSTIRFLGYCLFCS